mmetsp:Transcript_127848/g.225246  ORF Transcript_127848/g.225246 Transcript_127848/m.225246 type:complete len:220 (+) Transcript_127848:858-1517(+)
MVIFQRRLCQQHRHAADHRRMNWQIPDPHRRGWHSDSVGSSRRAGQAVPPIQRRCSEALSKKRDMEPLMDVPGHQSQRLLQSLSMSGLSRASPPQTEAQVAVPASPTEGVCMEAAPLMHVQLRLMDHSVQDLAQELRSSCGHYGVGRRSSGDHQGCAIGRRSSGDRHCCAIGRFRHLEVCPPSPGSSWSSVNGPWRHAAAQHAAAIWLWLLGHSREDAR